MTGINGWSKSQLRMSKLKWHLKFTLLLGGRAVNLSKFSQTLSGDTDLKSMELSPSSTPHNTWTSSLLIRAPSENMLLQQQKSSFCPRSPKFRSINTTDGHRCIFMGCSDKEELKNKARSICRPSAAFRAMYMSSRCRCAGPPTQPQTPTPTLDPRLPQPDIVTRDCCHVMMWCNGGGCSDLINAESAYTCLCCGFCISTMPSLRNHKATVPCHWFDLDRHCGSPDQPTFMLCCRNILRKSFFHQHHSKPRSALQHMKWCFVSSKNRRCRSSSGTYYRYLAPECEWYLSSVRVIDQTYSQSQIFACEYMLVPSCKQNISEKKIPCPALMWASPNSWWCWCSC